MDRILAIDHGRRRVGLALSDPLGLTARPLAALQVQSDQEAITALTALCREEEVGQLVLGIPVKMDGQEGPAARATRKFGERLKQELGLPVAEVDERLSSKEAHAVLKTAGVSHKKRKEHVDSAAALILLRQYLQQRP